MCLDRTVALTTASKRRQNAARLRPVLSPQETGEYITESKTLYARLGGYDAIAAVADDLVARLRTDAQLGRFWAHRGEDGVRREKQLLIDFLCASAGGPLYYTGRDMATSHKGMGIGEADWWIFIEHVNATLDKFSVPAQEKKEVLAFVDSTKPDIVGR